MYSYKLDLMEIILSNLECNVYRFSCTAGCWALTHELDCRSGTEGGQLCIGRDGTRHSPSRETGSGGGGGGGG